MSCTSPNHKNGRKDITFGESLGVAMVAATGAGAYHMDPLISSAAVAGASMTASNLDIQRRGANEISKMVTHMKFIIIILNMQILKVTHCNDFLHGLDKILLSFIEGHESLF